MLSPQLQAERSHVLKSLVYELGGLAHDHMSLTELDQVIDSMLSKGVPSELSPDLTRWVHTHHKTPGFKIQQILGTVMDTTKASLVPDCFAKFHDPTAPECKECLDRVDCRKRCTHNGNKETPVPVERIHAVYPVSNRADMDDIREIISQKTGQIARSLSQGNKVALVVSNNKLQVMTLDIANPEEEATMAKETAKANTKSKKAEEALDEEDEDLEEEVTPKAKKGAKAEAKPVKKSKKADEEDEDEDLDLETLDEDDEDEEEEEAPAPKSKKAVKPAAKKSKKAQEEDEEEEEDEDEEEEKPAKKAKKAKKEAPKLNKLQIEFQARLKTDLKDNEALFRFAKKLKVTWARKEDARIDRMLCAMAVKKHLGEQ